MAIEQRTRDVSVGTTAYGERSIWGVSWGAIFAGAFVALGVLLLLHLLGVGVGLTAIRPEDAGSLRGVGIGTGVWTLIAPIVALFIGGLVVGRLAGPLTGSNGAIHGAVMWALTTVVAALLVALALSAAIRTTVRAGTEAIGSVVGAAPGGGQTLETLGLDSRDLIAPVNERLAAQGKPRITAAQMEAAARDALASSVRQGRLDRQVLVQSIAERTALSRNDASEIAGQIERRFDERTSNARESALGAAEDTGKVTLGLFFASLLGLVSSMLGASLGVRSERRRTTPRAGYREVAVAR